MTEIESTPKTSATAGLRALLAEIVDYAGMFPPASLSLEEAVQRYAAHRRSDESWMLARFIVGAARLRELEASMHLFDAHPPLRLSVLPSGADTDNEFFAAFQSDLEDVVRFSRKHNGSVAVDQLELRLPRDSIGTDVVRVRRFLNGVDEILAAYDRQDLDVFYEIPLDDFLRQTLPILTGAIAAFNRDRSFPESGRACLKMRTGGTEPDAFPAVDDVAFVIASCRNAAVPFKATAGLHHPVRRYDESLRTSMHGFLNVFGAAALAQANDLDEKAIGAILSDDEPSHFRFSSDGLEWGDLSAPLRSIERVRSDRALSFGSCSFEEPVDDLKALRLL